MKKYLSLIILLVSFFTISCKENTSINYENKIVPLEYNSELLMAVVKLNIDGYIYDFCLDLSSRKNYISQKLAYKIANYKNNTRKLCLDSVQWGIYKFENVDFQVESQLNDGAFDGFLGYDFFSDYENITIDLANNKIILNDCISSSLLKGINYKYNDGFISFKDNNLKYALVFMLIPNLIVNSFKDYSHLQLNEINTFSYSDYQYISSIKQISDKNDVILGIPSLLSNTVTFNIRKKLIYFNQSKNNIKLPYRNVNEKISFCEKVPKLNEIYNFEQELYFSSNQSILLTTNLLEKKSLFILDTGAEDNVIFKTGLYNTSVKMNDYERSYKIYFPKMEIDNLVFENIGFTYFDYIESTCDGLLGMDFLLALSHQKFVDINYKNQTIYFSDCKPQSEPIHIKIENNKIICDLILNNKIYKAIIDSGMTTPSFFINYTGNDIFYKKLNQNWHTLYGKTTGVYPYIESLELSLGNKEIDLPFYNIDYTTYKTLFPKGIIQSNSEKIDIVLSMDFFKNYKIIFDFDNSYMWID